MMNNNLSFECSWQQHRARRRVHAQVTLRSKSAILRAGPRRIAITPEAARKAEAAVAAFLEAAAAREAEVAPGREAAAARKAEAGAAREAEAARKAEVTEAKKATEVVETTKMSERTVAHTRSPSAVTSGTAEASKDLALGAQLSLARPPRHGAESRGAAADAGEGQAWVRKSRTSSPALRSRRSASRTSYGSERHHCPRPDSVTCHRSGDSGARASTGVIFGHFGDSF